MIEIHDKNTKNQPLVQVFRLKKYVKEHFFLMAFCQSQRTD